MDPGPAFGIVEQDPGVGQVHARRFKSDLRAADPVDHRADLIGEGRAQGLLKAGRVGNPFLERGTRLARLGDDEVSLVKLGDELAAQPQRHGHARGEADQGRHGHQGGMPQDRSEGRRIEPLGQTYRQRIAL
jgi:hypothetical protein